LYLDELSVGVDPQHAAMLAQVLDEAAAFLAVAAKDCGSRAKQA
jgi:ABC-type Mn2+/Zn2+ transport system ATPase subunit